MNLTNTKIVSVAQKKYDLPFNRWTCFAWPAKIDDLIERTSENLTQDEERFSKILASDQANFEDKMDSLQMTVAGQFFFFVRKPP